MQIKQPRTEVALLSFLKSVGRLESLSNKGPESPKSCCPQNRGGQGDVKPHRHWVIAAQKQPTSYDVPPYQGGIRLTY